MFIITKARIQILNGSQIVKEIAADSKRTLETPEEIQAYRDKTLAYHKARILKRYAKKHPGATPPTVELLLNTKGTKEFYQQPLKPKISEKED